MVGSLRVRIPEPFASGITGLSLEALYQVRGEIDIELRDVALQESAYITVSGEDTTQINVLLSSAQPSVLHQIITDYFDTDDLQNGRHICTTPIKRVNAVCEEHAISDENKIYRYNLSASSHKYPDGVLSEGGYYFDGMYMMLLLSMCVFIVIEDIHCNVGVQSRGLDQEPNNDDKVKEEENLEVSRVVKYLLEKVKVTLAEIANQYNQIFRGLDLFQSELGRGVAVLEVLNGMEQQCGKNLMGLVSDSLRRLFYKNNDGGKKMAEVRCRRVGMKITKMMDFIIWYEDNENGDVVVL
ncbi:hypothetical protein Tco_0209602 [Tanacetum coccineum]